MLYLLPAEMVPEKVLSFGFSVKLTALETVAVSSQFFSSLMVWPFWTALTAS